ncbi:CPK2 [Symbiodinium pilosum]|uniref:non-specific serine/threonine protein kinase n=1 Tax=Symbiodinium pilosum TaxID=2952 RepID=A0A812IV40_SYMPI|nr:CPK2 [Symbiodinium pilosum]
MYKSKHAADLPPTASTFAAKGTTCPNVANIGGGLERKPVTDKSHSSFGKPKGHYCDDPGSFLKKSEKTGGKVLSLKEMKKEHPEALLPKQLKEQTRGGVPKASEQPVMNLVTSKNFIVANAVEVILAAPKKVPEGTKDYLKKEDYGKVPKYLQNIKQDIEAEYQYIRALQEQQAQAEAERVRPMTEDERQSLLEGLKAKWEQVNTAYQGGTHVTNLDTMGKLKRKEKHEAELSQLEKDIESQRKPECVHSLSSNAEKRDAAQCLKCLVLGQVSRQCLVHTRHGDDWNKVYLKGAKLGEGSYGEVFLALHASLGVARVVKSVPKSQLSVAGEQVEDEVNMLKSLDHPHIVRVFEAFESEESLHIVMDYAEGGDLASVIRETVDTETLLPQPWIRETAVQVASALDYMHSRGVIHCDLKPGNAMLLTPFNMEDAINGSRPHVLLVDFGLAEIFDEQAALGGPATVKGSPAYLSPEGFDGKLTQKSDTWALGVMLYEMLVGARPFRGTNNIFVLYCQVANNEPTFEKVPEVPRSLVRALMEKNPQARISARQCFDHEWLRSSLDQLDAHLQMPDSLGRPTSYFYRAVTFCMAAALGMKDLSRDTQLFETFDTDKSGQLDTEELKAGLARLGLRQDPSGLMAAMDLDQDGQISYTEFLAATLCLDEERGERLMRYAFSTFDLDDDGYISMPELRQLLSGEGALVADVLPDGQTVDEVMEEVSGGEGEISYSRFRAYLTRSYRSADRPVSATARGLVRHRTKELDVEEGSEGAGDTEMVEPEDASDLINRLDDLEEAEVEDDSGPEEGPGRTMMRQTTTGQLENSSEELMGFHQWLDDLFQDQRRDARLTFLLRFRDPRVEAAYVSYYLPATLRQAQVYALPVAAYAIWAVTTEHFHWQPSLLRWTSTVQAVNNLAWLVIFVGAFLMFTAIALWLWKRRQKGELLRAKGRQLSGKAKKQLVQAESEFDAQAVVAEHMLCAWTVVTPWVACFFANRRRLAALWGMKALDVFAAVSNDYEVILTMLGTLMFFSMRTNLSFAHALPMALSCFLAYGSSSIVLQSTVEADQNDFNWGWTGVLLAISSALCLSGHRNLEYQRRLSFLSLYASFAVLKDIEVDDPATFVDYMAFERRASSDAQNETPASGAVPLGMRETRLARLKRGQELLRRLSSSPGMGNQAFRNALVGLLDILSSAREDLAQADRLLKPDVGEQLQKQAIQGEAQQKLLDLFDDLPPVPRLPREVDKLLDTEGALNGSEEREKEQKMEAQRACT